MVGSKMRARWSPILGIAGLLLVPDTDARVPYVSPSMTVPLFVVDEANTVGCASDLNTGTSATATCSGGVAVGGVGPLLTSWEILARWGCTAGQYCAPLLNQTTEIRFISNATHAFGVHPWGSGQLIIDAPLGSSQRIFSGTATGFVPYNYVAANVIPFGTPGGFSTLTSWAGAQSGQLVYDSTANSYAWVIAVTGGVVTLGPQMRASAAPASLPFPAFTELSGPQGVAWASTDSIAVYNPVTIVFTDGDFRITSPIFNQDLAIYHVMLTEPVYGYPYTYFGDDVLMIESGTMNSEQATTGQAEDLFYNDYAAGSLSVAGIDAYPSPAIQIFGGVYQGGVQGTPSLQLGQVQLEANVYLGSISVGSYTIGRLTHPEGLAMGNGSITAEYGQWEAFGYVWGNPGGGSFLCQTGAWCVYNGPKAISQFLVNLGNSDTGSAFVYTTNAGVVTILGPTSLTQGVSGTFALTNGSPSVTASTSQTGSLKGGDSMMCSSQVGTVYTLSTVSGTSITLTGNYTGSSATAAVCKIQPLDRSVANGGFGGQSFNVFGGGSFTLYPPP